MARVLGDACLPCFFSDIVGALEVLEATPEQRDEVYRRMMAHLQQDFAKGWLPSRYITAQHRLLKEVLGVELPFAELRRRCNEVGLELSRRVREEVAAISDERERFRLLVRWAIAGNEVDFRTVGTGYDVSMDELHAKLSERIEAGLTLDQSDAAFEILAAGPRLLYVPDNVGEIALDRLLIEFLRERLGCEVTLCYRGGPITSDAVREDFEFVGLDTRVDRFILAGPDTLGISLEEATPELRDALTTSPVILTKGQANFYVCCELVPSLEPEQRVISLLTTKCRPIAQRFGHATPVINVCRVFAGRAQP